MADILIVEDERVLGRTIAAFLQRQGFTARFVHNASTAKDVFTSAPPKLAIVDYKLAYDNGLELLAWMRELHTRTQVVMMTGHGDVDLAVRAMKAGARDFLCKPVPLNMFNDLAKDLLLNVNENGQVIGAERLIGRSSIAVNLRRSIEKIATFSRNHNPPGILVMGPNGVGKSLIARCLHESALSPRKSFVSFDCSLQSQQTDSHLEAAFTESTGGTLTIRHVDQMRPELQALLMHLLVETDGRQDQPWVISTTTQPLLGDTHLSEFRADLLYRLQIGWLDVPPLMERSNDILPIAEFVARKVAAKHSQMQPKFTAEARIKLLEYAWPGNISELINCIERSMLTALNGVIDDTDLKMTNSIAAFSSSVPKLTQIETQALEHALTATKGNVSKAARLLGISRDKLRYRMQKLGLSRR